MNKKMRYIIKNVMMKDLSVLQESPFADYGCINDLFDKISIFMDLCAEIEKINKNAVTS